MVAGVRGGWPGSRGVGLGGLPGSCVSTSMYRWPWLGWLGWAVPGGLLGERWALEGFGGVLEACRWS